MFTFALIFALVVVVFATATVLVVYFSRRQTHKSETAVAQANTTAPIERVELDLGGRLPAKRRRPCGRHGGEGGGNCNDCEHKHEHDEAGHCHRE